MKFDIEKYKGKYVMHCKTKEEATDFCNTMHDLGKTWWDKMSYLHRTNFEIEKENTCYNFNEGTYEMYNIF